MPPGDLCLYCKNPNYRLLQNTLLKTSAGILRAVNVHRLLSIKEKSLTQDCASMATLRQRKETKPEEESKGSERYG